jgi:hypothetical protein
VFISITYEAFDDTIDDTIIGARQGRDKCQLVGSSGLNLMPKYRHVRKLLKIIK